MQWKLQHPVFAGMTLQLAVRDCPAPASGQGVALPYIAVTCAGALCQQMFKPCKVDADW